jgi:hypothetical protein
VTIGFLEIFWRMLVLWRGQLDFHSLAHVRGRRNSLTIAGKPDMAFVPAIGDPEEINSSCTAPLESVIADGFSSGLPGKKNCALLFPEMLVLWAVPIEFQIDSHSPQIPGSLRGK